MIPGANIISRKASVASIRGAGRSEPLSRGFNGWSPLRKFVGSKEHLDWLKIDSNAVEIRTVKDYPPEININIQAKSQAGNI